jgi:hypothetical protein
MNNFPSVVTMPFTDGARDVPEHIAVLLKQYKIPTHEMTYDKAIERMNWHNAEKAVSDQFAKIQTDHLTRFGT